mgnify:CR=1 FL=1
MSDNNELYEPDLISVTDDDGNEIVFELLERYETDDDVYVAITEYHDEAEEIVEADNEVIILKAKPQSSALYSAQPPCDENNLHLKQVGDRRSVLCFHRPRRGGLHTCRPSRKPL